MTFRLIHAGISTILCYSAFVAFLVLRNYPSAILAIVSGLSDNILFFLHYLYRNNELHQWYTKQDLRLICRLGIIFGTIGLLNLGYHTTLQILLNSPIFPIANSRIITIVWSAVLLRSGLILMYYCISYQNRSNVGLTEEEEETPQSEPVLIPGPSNVM